MTKNEFELATVKESSVFGSLRFYCRCFAIFTMKIPLWLSVFCTELSVLSERSIVKGIIASPNGSKFLSVRVDPFSDEGKIDISAP